MRQKLGRRVCLSERSRPPLTAARSSSSPGRRGRRCLPEWSCDMIALLLSRKGKAIARKATRQGCFGCNQHASQWTDTARHAVEVRSIIPRKLRSPTPRKNLIGRLRLRTFKCCPRRSPHPTHKDRDIPSIHTLCMVGELRCKIITDPRRCRFYVSQEDNASRRNGCDS